MGVVMPFTYEIREHKKDKHKFIEITGFEGSVSDLVVPEEIEGLKVEAVGNHSFSGRQDLRSVTLPESIKTLYGFAFHNCRNLEKISLFDSIDDYYDGVCRQCDSISEIDITVNRGWFEVIRNFLADNDKTLKFTIRVYQGKELTATDAFITSCLTFPEYVYDFNENTMARTIQFSIAGSGMFYRECVDRRSINYREYDKLFEKAKIDSGEIPQDIAIGRLLYPVELLEGYRVAYEKFVTDNGLAILKRLIASAGTDAASLEVLKGLVKYRTGESLFSEGDMDSAVRYASELGATEVTAVLMDSSSKAASESSGAMRFEF